MSQSAPRLPVPRWVVHLLYWHLPRLLGGRLALAFVVASVALPLVSPRWPLLLAIALCAAWFGWWGLSPKIAFVRSVIGGEQSPLFLLGTVLSATLSWGLHGRELGACLQGMGSTVDVVAARALQVVWLFDLFVFARSTSHVLRSRDLIRRAFAERGLPLAGEALSMPLPARFWPSLIVPWNGLVLPRVKTTRDIVFARVDGVDLKCDVYEPETVSAGTPILLLLHGGGWVLGDREVYFPELVALRLAHQGIIVVNSEYRLAPETPFPGQLIDCKRAIAWIRSPEFRFGGDRAGLIVGGESAGGNVALLAALTPNDPALAVPETPDADTRVAACVDLFGIHSVVDVDFVGGKRLADHWKFMEEWFLQTPHRPDDPTAMAVYDAASPTRRVRGGAAMPPVLTFHGMKDWTVPFRDAELFHESLACLRSREASSSAVPDVFVPLPGTGHAFCMWPSIRALAVADGIACFVRRVASANRATAVDVSAA